MKALEGIKVIDFSKWLPGQYCGMILADFGADVIKLEAPEGDPPRRFFPEFAPKMSYWHLMLNRNKRGMVLDIKQAAGQEVLKKLLAQADVFLEGFRPGYLKKFGLDYEAIKKINPKIIYCSITGFGQDGAFKHKPAHDLNVIGLAGLNSLDGYGEACVSECQASDVRVGLNAVIGICMALLAKGRLGIGQYRDINLYNTALSTQTTSLSSLWGCEATGCKPFGRTSHYYNIYKTKDNRYLIIGTIEPKFWERFCLLIGASELIARQFDFEHESEFEARIQELLMQKTQAEWLELIGTEEFCVTPVNTQKEAIASELTKESGMVEQKTHDLGTFNYVRPAIKLSATPAEIIKRAPILGEDTIDILTELGYEESLVAKLANDKVI